MTKTLQILLAFFIAAVMLPAQAQHKSNCRDVSMPCASTSTATQERRREVVRQLYRGLIYPMPLAILGNSASVEDIFQRDHVRGRVTPLGTYAGFESAIEYFYGLSGAPGGRVENVTIRSLVASNDKVAVTVHILLCMLPGGGCDTSQPVTAASTTLVQTGFFQFNGEDRIITFDLALQNLGAALDPVSEAQRQQTIQQTCGLLTLAPQPSGTTGTCPATFSEPKQFPPGFPLSGAPGPQGAFANCVALMRSIPYGSWNRANSNTFTCRQLHSLLTILRPEHHCPHTSASGGQVCVDVPYSSYFTEFPETASDPHRHH